MWKYLSERIFTYAVALATTSVMLYSLIRIHLNGYIKFVEPNIFVRVSEIIMLSIGLLYILKFLINDVISRGWKRWAKK